MVDDRLDKLLALAETQHAIIAEQGKQIGQQAESIALLTQSVAMLLGEEIGTPVPEEAEQAPRVDLDGTPY